jgi:hypothetical protein
MESVSSYGGREDKEFTVWAINDNLGYTFVYSVPTNIRFDRYLDGFKDMIC